MSVLSDRMTCPTGLVIAVRQFATKRVPWRLRTVVWLQISFLAICYPVLILTYLGQAAWLIAHPDQVSSTFYASIPFGDGFYWVSIC